MRMRCPESAMASEGLVEPVFREASGLTPHGAIAPRPADAPGAAASRAPGFDFSALLALMRRRAAAGQCAFVRQALGALALRTLRGLGPGYYQESGLWQREVGWRQLLAHPSPRHYRATLDRLNPPAYRKVFQHKLYEKATLELLGLPTAPFVAYLHRSRGQRKGGGPLRTLAQFDALLAERLGERLCFKETEGWGGRGFKAVEILAAGGKAVLRPLDRPEPIDSQTYWREVLGVERGADWLVEHYVVQHPSFARFNASSLNTVRMVMARDAAGRALTLGAYLRIGRAGSLVDNISAGGVLVSIDVDQGRLVRLRECRPDFEPMTHHPATGQALAGETLHDWTGIRTLAEQAIERIPTLRFAEFDIGLAETGPLIVEVNPDTAQDWMVDVIPLPDRFPLDAL